jgi:hypothetical protein
VRSRTAECNGSADDVAACVLTDRVEGCESGQWRKGCEVCEVGLWAPWSVRCGDGTRTRTRDDVGAAVGECAACGSHAGRCMCHRTRCDTLWTDVDLRAAGACTRTRVGGAQRFERKLGDAVECVNASVHARAATVEVHAPDAAHPHAWRPCGAAPASCAPARSQDSRRAAARAPDAAERVASPIAGACESLALMAAAVRADADAVRLHCVRRWVAWFMYDAGTHRHASHGTWSECIVDETSCWLTEDHLRAHAVPHADLIVIPIAPDIRDEWVLCIVAAMCC